MLYATPVKTAPDDEYRNLNEPGFVLLMETQKLEPKRQSIAKNA
jgi:hypothetical protein